MITEHQNQDTFFTIIIPTRERSDTLIHTLKTALSQDYDQFQVLVSDNASQDDTREKVNSISDSRLKYVNSGRRISMSENWEFALSQVDRGWITVLGDDDAILPGTLSKVNEIIKKTGISAIRSNGCSYQWPGFNDSKYGSLSVCLKENYEFRNSGQMLRQVLDGERHYNELPMLYNGGFVCFDLIRKAKLTTSNFFLSMTPDVYSAIVFSLLTESYVYSYEPLCINGASLHSGGTAGFEQVRQKRTYDPAEKFWSEKNIPFHEELPLLKCGRPVRSIQVIVFEAFLQAEKFHFLKPVKVNYQQQLMLALEKSGPDHHEIIEWCTLFAEKHNLECSKMSRYSIWHNRLGSVIGLFTRALQNYKLKGTPLNPILNVSDAAVIAGALKEIHPSVVGVMFNNFKNLLNGNYVFEISNIKNMLTIRR